MSLSVKENKNFFDCILWRAFCPCHLSVLVPTTHERQKPGESMIPKEVWAINRSALVIMAKILTKKFISCSSTYIKWRYSMTRLQIHVDPAIKRRTRATLVDSGTPAKQPHPTFPYRNSIRQSCTTSIDCGFIHAKHPEMSVEPFQIC